MLTGTNIKTRRSVEIRAAQPGAVGLALGECKAVYVEEACQLLIAPFRLIGAVLNAGPEEAAVLTVQGAGVLLKIRTYANSSRTVFLPMALAPDANPDAVLEGADASAVIYYYVAD
jgi:hypothetical protein